MSDDTDKWVLINMSDARREVDAETLFDSFTDWSSWMSFARLLMHNRPALMHCQDDGGGIEDFMVVRARDIKPSSTFRAPHGSPS